MLRSKLRRPASTWASRMPSFDAASAPATVELTSPTTTTQSGRCSKNTGSNRRMISAVCASGVPEPTPRLTSGGGISNSRKKASLIRSS